MQDKFSQTEQRIKLEEIDDANVYASCLPYCLRQVHCGSSPLLLMDGTATQSMHVGVGPACMQHI